MAEIQTLWHAHLQFLNAGRSKLVQVLTIAAVPSFQLACMYAV